MDARQLPDEPDALADTLEEYTTFGRVRPDQKRAMVHALQSRGHTVAMTGDGVNDVLGAQGRRHRRRDGSGQFRVARRRADRAAGQQVRDPAVRRRRGPAGDRQHRAGLEPVPHQDRVLGAAGDTGRPRRAWRPSCSAPIRCCFPFQPIHVTIAAWFTIGIPAFVLSLAPNNERAHPGFVRRVMTVGAAVRAGRRRRDVRLLPAGVPGPRRRRRAADAGVDRGVDHAAGDGACGCSPWWRGPTSGGGWRWSPLSGLAYVVIFSHSAGAEGVHARPVECRGHLDGAAIGVVGGGADRGRLVGSGCLPGRTTPACGRRRR